MIDLKDRLRQARIDAGYEDASTAVKEFGWTYSTYLGHENGSRGVKNPDVAKYAKAFGVSESYLLTGRSGTTTQNRDTPENHKGHPETHVTPFTAPSDRTRTNILKLAETLSPRSKKVEVYQLRTHYPSLMLLSGDILIIDAHVTVATPGQIVVTLIGNAKSGSERTALRLAASPHPIPPIGEPALDSTESERMVGVVVASMRPNF